MPTIIEILKANDTLRMDDGDDRVKLAEALRSGLHAALVGHAKYLRRSQQHKLVAKGCLTAAEFIKSMEIS